MDSMQLPHAPRRTPNPTRHNTLSLSGRYWVEPSSTTPPANWVDTILTQRHTEYNPEEREHFLHPSLGQLPNPSLIVDLDVAAERLFLALERNEAIAIYGDYDVDGVCSASLMVEFLRELGGTVNFYIPNRRTEGYGLNPTAIRTLCSDATVLVTTDCGITAYEDIALARALGSDVIVVDHHTVPPKLPPANACLDPMRPDCTFPFKGLCAAGVAFMLMGGLRRLMRDRGCFRTRPEPDVRLLLDLVALATVADMVPLLESNRALVTAGLKHMSRSARVGIRALAEVSGIDLPSVDAFDIGFKLAPRINARGRLSHAGAAVELMLTTDPLRAQALAKTLDEQNTLRRELEASTAEAAIGYCNTHALHKGAGIVIENPSWHAGVLGLVASRLVSRFYRPALVIGEGGKGSARSISGVNIYEAIHRGAMYLERFGGHAAAAGLTILPTNVKAFAEEFRAGIIEQIGVPPYHGKLTIDLVVNPTTLTLNGCAALNALAPFGQQNPEPILMSRKLKVLQHRVVGATGEHVKLSLGTSTGTLDAIGFRLARYCNALPTHVDVAYTPEPNTFRGRTTLQLRIQDLRPA